MSPALPLPKLSVSDIDNSTLSVLVASFFEDFSCFEAATFDVEGAFLISKSEFLQNFGKV